MRYGTCYFHALFSLKKGEKENEQRGRNIHSRFHELSTVEAFLPTPLTISGLVGIMRVANVG